MLSQIPEINFIVDTQSENALTLNNTTARFGLGYHGPKLWVVQKQLLVKACTIETH